MAKQHDECTMPHRPCLQPDRLIFAGERAEGETRVTVTQGGQHSRDLPLRLAVRNHSPTGFEWGYCGSGPAQLALAFCIEVVGVDRAERSYQSVKDRLVAAIQDDAWMMSGTRILEAVEHAERSEHRSGGGGMKASSAQARIVGQMARGARLRWDSATGSFQLVDGTSTRTVQGRTVDALAAAGLIQRDALGDCVLSRAGLAMGVSSTPTP